MSDNKAAWKALAEKELRGRPLDDLTWKTLEGIDVSPVYTEDDTKDLPHMGSMPGIGPFTRGPKATMYAGRPWTIRQYAGFSTAEESHAFHPRHLPAKPPPTYSTCHSLPHETMQREILENSGPLLTQAAVYTRQAADEAIVHVVKRVNR